MRSSLPIQEIDGIGAVGAEAAGEMAEGVTARDGSARVGGEGEWIWLEVVAAGRRREVKVGVPPGAPLLLVGILVASECL